MAVGQKFGQHEPLTTRLHNLVRSYPKGLGVLKEFIQNADDAEADEIVFVIDEQQYDVAGLPSQMQWLHTSPALLVYNNKPFSDHDIESIQKIGESGKSDSVGKTGRFGLGFNACFNVTDVPCFFTRGAVYFFDPHFQTVPDASIESPGRRFGVKELVSVGWPLLTPFRNFVGDGSSFDGTVFRLPFRTDRQAYTSLIKKEAFTISDAFEAVRELREMGSAILLFLKHVRRLRIEHRRRDGSVLALLSIQATNSDAIVESRSDVNSLLSKSDPNHILTDLVEKGSVYSSCCHMYNVVVEGVASSEKWRVVDGFFVDGQEEVVRACRKMIENGEKALPYAGAAWLLDQDRTPAGRIYCFLPVPMQTNVPVQINGYFDLDDSRQSMFLDQSSHGVASLRVDWNRTLLQTSVAQAYVRLLEDLRSDLGADEIVRYYCAFPNAVANESSWEGWLTRSFYALASSTPLIRVSDDRPWSDLQGSLSLPQALFSVGDALISERFLPIHDPPLPRHLQDGFATIELEIPVLSPSELRVQLKVDYDLNCPLNAAPRACLRQRKYVEQIFCFCLTDLPGKDIRGLPLAIDSRGHLRTVGLTNSPLYLAGQSLDIDVFVEHPEWFVELEFARVLNLTATEDADLFDMDGECFVQKLADYVMDMTDEADLKMRGGKSGPLTDRWLRVVFKRLLNSDLNGLDMKVNELPLIPAQSRVLHRMGTEATPLLFSGSRELKRALTALKLPLVTGVSDELHKLLVQFSTEHDCIWFVTPRDLIDTLVDQCSEEMNGYVQVTEVQRALLGYFSKEENISALRNLPIQQEKLKSLRLFPTTSGSLVDLSEAAYVSQDFTFPRVNFDVVLLDDGPSHRWRDLYHLLGTPELSRSRLIREMLLPGFVSLGVLGRGEVSTWLRDNLSIAQSEAGPDDSDLLDEVREAFILVCEDGEVRAPKDIYQPDSKIASAVLGEEAVFPDMVTAYAHERKRWLEFFRQLDMPVDPRLCDVIECVRTLADGVFNRDKAGRFQAIYDFIRERVSTEIRDQKGLSEEMAEAVVELSSFAWLPLRQDAGNLLCFSPSDEPYGRPAEVYFARVGQLLASQACITVLTPEPNKRTRQAMGFPVNTPIELVLNHFQEILTTCSEPETMPNESILVRALGQIYRELGGESPVEAYGDDDDTIEENSEVSAILKTRFSSVPCIWDQQMRRFWRPDHVFLDNVQYMEPWRRTVRSSEEAIERGYSALGRVQSPTTEDWKQVLVEISESDTSPSRHEVNDVIRNLVHYIVDDLVDLDSIDGEVLVPTRWGKLLAAETVYMADAPWYDSKLDSWEIPILANSVSGIPEIQRRLGIPSLAHSVEQRLIEHPVKSELENARLECSRLEFLLQSNEFLSGLRRLLRHEGAEVSEEALSHLGGVRVRCVKTIRTCLYLRVDGNERFLGDDVADSYWDHEEFQAMLVETRERYFCNDLAELLNRAFGSESLHNLAPLVQALGCSLPGEIPGVLDDLKIRNYSIELENDFEFVDEVDVQEFPTDEDVEIELSDFDTSQELHQVYPNDVEHSECDTGSPAGNPDQLGTVSLEESSTATNPRSSGVGKIGETKSSNEAAGLGHTAERHLDIEQVKSSDAIATSSREATTGSRQPPSQRRLVSYVSYTESEASHEKTSSDDDGRRLQIGNAAVEIVINYEKEKRREARSMAHPNAGYDVISEGDGQTRYIEVKGTEVAWGERGVALTATQFFYASKNPDRDLWLYVVEDVFSQFPQVHEIHRPSEMVDRFVFDGGWRQVAETAGGTGIEMSIPLPGDEVLQGDAVVGIVDSTLASGRFPLVIYSDLEGNQHRKLLRDVAIRHLDEMLESIAPEITRSCVVAKITTHRTNIGVSPSEMTGTMIIQGDRILSNSDMPTSSGRFQLIRRADWTNLLNAFPTDSVKETFLNNIIAVWNHTDHPGWCWIQTHA